MRMNQVSKAHPDGAFRLWLARKAPLNLKVIAAKQAIEFCKTNPKADYDEIYIEHLASLVTTTDKWGYIVTPWRE